MTWTLRIEIPGRLMSENASNRNVSEAERAAVYSRTGKRMHGRKLTPAAAQWKREVAQTVQIEAIRALRSAGKALTMPRRIALDFEVCDEWETKVGKPVRRDLNCKLLQDAVCAGLGLDDCYVYDVRSHKVPLRDGKPVMVVTVRPWEGNDVDGARGHRDLDLDSEGGAR